MAGDIVNMPVASNQDFMRSIVEMDDLIRQFELDMKRKRLLGYEAKQVGTDVQGNPIIKDEPVYQFYGKPRITDEGLQDIIAEIRGVLNPNTPYSYTTEQSFNNYMMASSKAFAIRLWVKMKEWKVEPSDYLVICGLVRGFKELALRKSIGKNFQDFSASSKSSSETVISERQEKGGIFGIFGPPKNKQM